MLSFKVLLCLASSCKNLSPLVILMMKDLASKVLVISLSSHRNDMTQSTDTIMIIHTYALSEEGHSLQLFLKEEKKTSEEWHFKE